ncbi:unnamed protein product, partial [Mesorhabditis belari]|uniref:EGF-like calcium-binding domain-containing protein n=1 Tax=Mesorhabditis belari TaxID=2138241 RepID=A0AAF3FRC4_9BILA
MRSVAINTMERLVKVMATMEDANISARISVMGNYYCHCRDGFQTDPQNPLDCIDVDECKGNNTCIQLCLNTKGSYLCRCTDNYENKVVVGAMTGKDCRANRLRTAFTHLLQWLLVRGKDNRIFWADPKFKRVFSILPDGTDRQMVVQATEKDDKAIPFAIDVF